MTPATFSDHLAYALDPAAFAVACGLKVLDPWQATLLRDQDHDWLVNTSRQSGKSTIASLKGLHLALYRPESLTLLVSAGARQASELFKRCVASYRRLGKPIVAESENASSMTLENASRIISLPSLPSTVRGYSDVDLIVIDEASQVPDEMLAALLPMRALSAGQLCCLSTPFGRRGFFFENFESDSPAWRRVRVPASEILRLSPEVLEAARATLGQWAYSQEFECVFGSNTASVFTPAELANLIHPEVEQW